MILIDILQYWCKIEILNFCKANIKTKQMKKTLSIFLILTFLSSPGYALAPSLVSDPGVNPNRSAQLQGDIATKLEPGAIGNGVPLLKLAQGKLPPRASLADSEYQEIHQKLLEAIKLAIKLSIDNETHIPQQHKARAKQALTNLILLQNNLSKEAYLYNAEVRGPEDYLLGFNFQNNRGFALEVVRRLYDISPQRLAQYVYHECVPEAGVITERDDHRVVYNEIQSAIFGKDEVAALKKDLREFINKRTTSGLTDKRIVIAPKGVLAVAKPAIKSRPLPALTRRMQMRRWFSAFSYARRFDSYNRKFPSRGKRRDMRRFFSRFDEQERSELFRLIDRAFSYDMSTYGTSSVFHVLLNGYPADFDQIKNDLEFCINARQGSYIFASLPEMRQNITDADMQKIWFDLAFRLASMGIFLKDVMERGSAIAKVCETSQELRIVAGLVNETSQRLAKEGKEAVKKKVRDNYGVAVGCLLAETLVISKNVEDLAINLKYLEIIVTRFFQEPERMREDSSFFNTSSVKIGKLISEARRFNMQGQGFGISIKRGKYAYPTDENGNTYEAYEELDKTEIIPGSIRVPVVAAISAEPHVVIKTDDRNITGRLADMGKTGLLGAIGNGRPLAELAEGKLPPRAVLSDEQYQEIVKKLKKAIELAIRFSTAKDSSVEMSYRPRAREALANLVFLKNNLSNHLYLFNAVVKGPEDYLVGFNFKEYRGIAIELVNGLYEISPRRLAQYIYHECVQEEGDITSRNDHRAIYNNIQSTIFGREEVLALKKDLRSFIDSRQPQAVNTNIEGNNIEYPDIEKYRQDRDGLSSGVIKYGVTNEEWYDKTEALISSMNATKAFIEYAEKLWWEKSHSSINVYVRDPTRYHYYLYLVKPILSMTSDIAEFRSILSQAVASFNIINIPITCEFEAHQYEQDGINQIEGLPVKTERTSDDASIFDLTRAIEFVNSKLPSKMSIVVNDLPVRAKLFTANLTQILAQHQDQLFFMGIETDIGLDQKAQIMPIYKAIDEIKDMKDADGKPLFPNLVVKRGKAADLVAEVASLKEDGKLALNNTFIGARKLSVDNRLYDSIKGEGKAWISAIDDSRPGDYLPVFESITLSMMAYLNADITAIKNFYDAISEKPIDTATLQDMVRNRIIYILPRSTKFDIKQLRDLYELAQQLHTAA